ncbi:atlastin1 [Penaeus vannamei]|uniref:Atlastin1 n=1 Tax=Penaeus vannamei TaxID=6689 RepID=A0A423T1T0_PENVA|nr:atlastin1 [Penaeus vannamei]
MAGSPICFGGISDVAQPILYSDQIIKSQSKPKFLPGLSATAGARDSLSRCPCTGFPRRRDYQDIEEQFVNHLKILVPRLLSAENLVKKEIGGQPVKARDLLKFFTLFMEVFKDNDLPEPTTLVEVSGRLAALAAAPLLHISRPIAAGKASVARKRRGEEGNAVGFRLAFVRPWGALLGSAFARKQVAPSPGLVLALTQPLSQQHQPGPAQAPLSTTLPLPRNGQVPRWRRGGRPEEPGQVPEGGAEGERPEEPGQKKGRWGWGGTRGARGSGASGASGSLGAVGSPREGLVWAPAAPLPPPSSSEAPARAFSRAHVFAVPRQETRVHRRRRCQGRPPASAPVAAGEAESPRGQAQQRQFALGQLLPPGRRVSEVEHLQPVRAVLAPPLGPLWDVSRLAPPRGPAPPPGPQPHKTSRLGTFVGSCASSSVARLPGRGADAKTSLRRTFSFMNKPLGSRRAGRWHRVANDGLLPAAALSALKRAMHSIGWGARSPPGPGAPTRHPFQGVAREKAESRQEQRQGSASPRSSSAETTAGARWGSRARLRAQRRLWLLPGGVSPTPSQGVAAPRTQKAATSHYRNSLSVSVSFSFSVCLSLCSPFSLVIHLGIRSARTVSSPPLSSLVFSLSLSSSHASLPIPFLSQSLSLGLCSLCLPFSLSSSLLLSLSLSSLSLLSLSALLSFFLMHFLTSLISPSPLPQWSIPGISLHSPHFLYVIKCMLYAYLFFHFSGCLFRMYVLFLFLFLFSRFLSSLLFPSSLLPLLFYSCPHHLFLSLVRALFPSLLSFSLSCFSFNFSSLLSSSFPSLFHTPSRPGLKFPLPRSRTIDPQPRNRLARMATRGPEGRAPLPSAVTSPSDDNKPRPGGDPTRTDDYLDFEGNVRPRSAHGAPSASEGKAVDGRDRRREAKRGQREETPQGTRKFNNFNYWRKKLPDVTREIQYILTPKSARRSLRRDVNGNEGDASFSASPEAKADPREAGLRERRNLGSLAVGKPSKHSAWEEEDELEEEEGRRGKGKGKGRRPATPRRHHAAAGLVPYAFVECAGESSTDDFEYIPGAGRDGPRVGHEAPDRRGDRGADDDDEEDEEVAELEDDHFRALAVDRPKSGSFSYYSGLVSARPFGTAPRCPTSGNFLTVDNAASEFFRRSSAPVGTLSDILGKFHATRKVPGSPGSSPSSAAVLGLLSRLSSDGDFNHNSEEDIYSSRGSRTLSGLVPFEYDTDDSEAEDSYDIMGNIQGAEGRRAAKGDKQKAKGKGKLAKGKSPSKGKLQGSRDALDDVTTPSSVMAATVGMTPSPRRQQGSSPVTPGTPLATTPLAPSPQHPKAPASIVTDSWKQARKIEDEGLGGGTGQAPVAFADSSSSSESVFTEARSGGPGRNGSLHDALTPVGDDAGGGAATPVFTETLDLPIDAIMGGYYSSSETSSVCSRPPTVAGKGGSSSSLLDEKKTGLDDVGETTLKKEREKTERGRVSSPSKKTARREGEEGGEGEGVEVSVPGQDPPPARTGRHNNTLGAQSESAGPSASRQRLASPVEVVLQPSVDTSPGSRPSTRTPSRRREKPSVSESVSDSVTAADEDAILSPAGVDLEFSVSSVYEECDEGGEHARPHPLRYVPSASASYEESLGSFICLDLESEGGPTRPSAGDTLEDEPGGGDADRQRSFSADDLDDLELEEGECYEYSGEEYEDDMPQASGAGRGRGGQGAAVPSGCRGIASRERGSGNHVESWLCHARSCRTRGVRWWSRGRGRPLILDTDG